MRFLFLLLFASLCFYACTNQNGNKQSNIQAKPAFVTNKTADTLCFARYSGLQKQDTASISMIIKKDHVSGTFSVFLYEKDARVGTISGTRDKGMIKGIWKYQQEGMNDSIRVEFKIQGNTLLQRKSHFDLNSGREALSDTAAFSLEYQKVNCGR